MPKNTTEAKAWQCPYIIKCPFFVEHKESLPDLCDKLKKECCLKDNAHCARFRLRSALGPESVPILMMPHQHEWADQILMDADKDPSEYPR